MRTGFAHLALAVALSVCFGTRAAAATLDRTVRVQGRLDTSGGTPASGTFELTFSLFAAETGGTAAWSQVKAGVVVAGGIFDVDLGPIAEPVLEAAPMLWLETKVGADALPRQPLRSVPYALMAQRANVAQLANDLACSGCVGAADLAPSLTLTGNVSIAGGLAPCTAGTPGCSLGLPGGGSVAAGSAGWVHLLSPSGLRIRNAADDAWSPLHFGGGVAYGDLAITGTATIGTNLVVCNAGSCSPSFPGGAGHAFIESTLRVGSAFGVDDSGGVTAASLSATRISAAASVRVGPEGSACDGSLAGAIRFVNGGFQGCNGTAWSALGGGTVPTLSGISPSSGGIGTAVTISGGGFVQGVIVHIGGRWADVTAVNATTIGAVVPEGGLLGAKDVRVQNPDGQSAVLGGAFTLAGAGTSQENALESCLDIKNDDPGAVSGVFYVDPDGGSKSNAFQVYCDMTTDGGGWTLVRVANGTTSPDLRTEAAVNASSLTSPTANTNAQLASLTVNQLGNVLMSVNTAASFDSALWYDRNRACETALKTLRWTFSSSLPVVASCPSASSVYPPSQNKWGQDVGGGTHINYNSTHPLCFGSWTNPSKGHVCFNRNAWDWWNYGADGATTGNGSAKTATYVRRSDEAVAGATCKTIKTANGGAGDGIYLIDPDGGSADNAFLTHCEMTTDGGGWTLVRVANGTTSPDLRTEAAVNSGSLSAGPTVNANAQLASSVVNQIGTVLMTRNTAAGYETALWYDRLRACNPALTTLYWTYQPSLPVVSSCPSASSIYPPSQNLWGQNVGGGTHINYNSTHPLCFGSWTPGTKGHFCYNRNGWDWWNYGVDAATSNNAAPRTATWIR